MFNPQTLHLEMMRNATFSLRRKPTDDLAAWQERARDQLGRLLGMPTSACAPDAAVYQEYGYESRVQCGGRAQILPDCVKPWQYHFA